MTTSSSAPAALITGGTSGIGLATARMLHTDGYEVLVTGRNPDTLAAVRRTLPDGVGVLRADARSLADADEVADELKRRFGKVDLVFLNAATVLVGSIGVVDEETFDQQFDVNVKGQFFNASALADKGMPDVSVYSGDEIRAKPAMG